MVHTSTHSHAHTRSRSGGNEGNERRRTLNRLLTNLSVPLAACRVLWPSGQQMKRAELMYKRFERAWSHEPTFSFRVLAGKECSRAHWLSKRQSGPSSASHPIGATKEGTERRDEGECSFPPFLWAYVCLVSCSRAYDHVWLPAQVCGRELHGKWKPPRTVSICFFSFLGEPPGWIYNYLISMCVPDETPASRAIAQRHISLLASIWPNLSGGSVCSCHTSVPRIKPCARWDVCVCVSKSDKLCPPKSSSNRARMIDCVVHAELLRARARPRTLSHCVPNNLSMTKGWHRHRWPAHDARGMERVMQSEIGSIPASERKSLRAHRGGRVCFKTRWVLSEANGATCVEPAAASAAPRSEKEKYQQCTHNSFYCRISSPSLLFKGPFLRVFK